MKYLLTCFISLALIASFNVSAKGGGSFGGGGRSSFGGGSYSRGSSGGSFGRSSGSGSFGRGSGSSSGKSNSSGSKSSSGSFGKSGSSNSYGHSSTPYVPRVTKSFGRTITEPEHYRSIPINHVYVYRPMYSSGNSFFYYYFWYHMFFGRTYYNSGANTVNNLTCNTDSDCSSGMYCDLILNPRVCQRK